MATIKANIMRLSCDVHCGVFNYEKRRKGYWENYNLNVNLKNDAPEVPDSGVHIYVGTWYVPPNLLLYTEYTTIQ